MPGLNKNDPNDFRVATGKLKDGWTYEVTSIPQTDRFHATVSHPPGDAASGGAPWPIEYDTINADCGRPTHPTYPTIEEAQCAARGYVEILSQLPGYPDPDNMKARGFQPTLLQVK